MTDLIDFIQQDKPTSPVVTADKSVVEILAEKDAKQDAKEIKEDLTVTVNPSAFYEQSCTPTADVFPNLYSNKIMLVNSGLYTSLAPPTSRNFNKPIVYPSDISDNFRYIAEKYWVNKDEKAIVFANNQLTPTTMAPFETRISAPVYNEAGVIPVMEQIC